MTDLPPFLKQHENEIRDANLNKKIPYNDSYWRDGIEKWVPTHLRNKWVGSAMSKINNKHKGKISRSDIFRMVKATKAKPSLNDIRQIFLATMFWGYGSADNRASWRVAEMVQSEGFDDTIRSVYNILVKEHDVESAYKTIKGEICWLGPAFFTKYFYFLGRECEIEPLILDDRVRKKSENEMGIKFTDSKKGYMEYITNMKCWADQINVEAWKIEYFLFKPDKKMTVAIPCTCPKQVPR